MAFGGARLSVLMALAAAVVSAGALLGASPAKALTASEQACVNNVQGIIAWNYSGNTAWNPSNVNSLCAGTNNPTQPGKCFETAMFGGVKWGSGTQWKWQDARDLCKGTNNATTQINCYKQRLSFGMGSKKAVESCASVTTSGATPEDECYDKVQGKIAWNYTNNVNWSPQNVKNLCAGTSFPNEPGKCFKNVMFGGVNHGGGTVWNWQDASKLCKGANHANQRINCFKNRIANGMNQANAINACKTAGGGG
jgi:hypothetical protein